MQTSSSPPSLCDHLSDIPMGVNHTTDVDNQAQNSFNNNGHHTDTTMLDINTKINEDTFLSVASGDVNQCQVRGQDVNTFGNGTKDNSAVDSGIEDQIDPTTDTNNELPINANGSQIDSKTKNQELSNTITEHQISQADAKNHKVVQHNATSSLVTDDNSTENDAEGQNPVEKLNGIKTNADTSAEKPEEIRRDDGDGVDHVAGEDEKTETDNTVNGHPMETRQLPSELSANEALQSQNATIDGVHQGEDAEMIDAHNMDEVKPVKEEIVPAIPQSRGNALVVETDIKHEADGSPLPKPLESATHNSPARVSLKAENHSAEKAGLTQATPPLMAEGDDGTPQDQVAFIKELQIFYRQRSTDFKPPKFYGQPLNCLKLWRAVLRLGGYDTLLWRKRFKGGVFQLPVLQLQLSHRSQLSNIVKLGILPRRKLSNWHQLSDRMHQPKVVTASKLWRQIGESFHPPKTCTTVSWTFRIFYEKTLLEYERHKRQIGELQIPVELPEASDVTTEGNGYQGSGSGRIRRDSAACAMQGWHAQRLFGSDEVGEPVIKDKNVSSMPKRVENLKSIGSLKQKRPDEVEHSVKAARTEISKQLVTQVADVGPPADWVKVNVRQAKDCFEIYALVPGLLREEVRVQSDPAGRLVISGQPEQVDNPWGVTPFKKVVRLPARIDPRHTSAVVSLHGRLFVRVPFEKANA